MDPEQIAQILPMLIGAIIIEGIALTILTYLVLRSKGEPPIIEEVFTVYGDGRLIKHVSNKNDDHADEVIFTGMLTVVQAFIRDSFGDRDSSDVKKIEFGKKRIFFERGEHIYLAVVYTGDVTKNMRENIIESIDAVETRYANVLEKWDGDIGKMENIEELIRPLLNPENP